MIVCSCAVVTDAEIEQALLRILKLPDGPLPTPGVVFRHLGRKMVCGSCAPLVVSTIYEKVDELSEKGYASLYAGTSLQEQLLRRMDEDAALRLKARARIRKVHRRDP